jgi:hypothetical protein
MADFLDEKRREINDRLHELKPLVEEYERLQGAIEALSSINGAQAATHAPAARRGPGRPRTRTASTANPRATAKRPARAGVRRAGRPKGSGGRAAQALGTVQEQPGITIPELANRMGIKPPRDAKLYLRAGETAGLRAPPSLVSAASRASDPSGPVGHASLIAHAAPICR